MRRIAAIALMLLAAVASGAAWAQAVATQEPTAAQRCLTVLPSAPDSQPVYPFEPFKRGKSGKVSVELRFTGADLRPAVEILSHEGDDAFVDAVTEHARHLRVPCLASREAASTVRFDYLFRPESDRPAQSEPKDPRAAQRAAQIACVRHASGRDIPDYPRNALQEGQQGRVLVQLRFASADAPPVAQVHARRSAGLLRRQIEDWVQGLRMPCHGGEPVEYTLTYIYLIEGDAYGFLPNMTFGQLLSAVPAAQRERLPPDSTGMGCPFNVRFIARQPELPNHVSQLDDWRAERQPLLAWLREVTLEGPTRLRDAVYGDTTRFQVPCYKIQSTAQANPSTNKE